MISKVLFGFYWDMGLFWLDSFGGLGYNVIVLCLYDGCYVVVVSEMWFGDVFVLGLLDGFWKLLGIFGVD